MKKENRKLAQERRAKARRNQQIGKYVKIGVLAVGCIAICVVFVLWLNGTGNKEEKETNNTTTTTNTSTPETTPAEKHLCTDTSCVVKDGDTVNIDYVGSVDGVEFAGGNTQGNGADLVIGSHSYIDDFEEQLIGHAVGETVEVVVTFPDNYGNTELAGKEAVFETVINGIYE